jgi:hypothetical protein
VSLLNAAVMRARSRNMSASAGLLGARGPMNARGAGSGNNNGEQKTLAITSISGGAPALPAVFGGAKPVVDGNPSSATRWLI